jgi:uncharacterized integral membrane protein
MTEPDRRSYPFSVRQTVAIVLLVLGVIFILENRRSTTIRFLVPVLTAPLWVALLGSLLVGVVAGALITRNRDS